MPPEDSLHSYNMVLSCQHGGKQLCCLTFSSSTVYGLAAQDGHDRFHLDFPARAWGAVLQPQQRNQ